MRATQLRVKIAALIEPVVGVVALIIGVALWGCPSGIRASDQREVTTPVRIDRGVIERTKHGVAMVRTGQSSGSGFFVLSDIIPLDIDEGLPEKGSPVFVWGAPYGEALVPLDGLVEQVGPSALHDVAGDRVELIYVRIMPIGWPSTTQRFYDICRTIRYASRRLAGQRPT